MYQHVWDIIYSSLHISRLLKSILYEIFQGKSLHLLLRLLCFFFIISVFPQTRVQYLIVFVRITHHNEQAQVFVQCFFDKVCNPFRIILCGFKRLPFCKSSTGQSTPVSLNSCLYSVSNHSKCTNENWHDFEILQLPKIPQVLADHFSLFLFATLSFQQNNKIDQGLTSFFLFCLIFHKYTCFIVSRFVTCL